MVNKKKVSQFTRGGLLQSGFDRDSTFVYSIEGVMGLVGVVQHAQRYQVGVTHTTD